MGLSGLFGQVSATATSHAQSADKQGGQKGGPDVVAHGVGDGHVQGVAVEGVVEGVMRRPFRLGSARRRP